MKEMCKVKFDSYDWSLIYNNFDNSLYWLSSIMLGMIIQVLCLNLIGKPFNHVLLSASQSQHELLLTVNLEFYSSKC